MKLGAKMGEALAKQPKATLPGMPKDTPSEPKESGDELEDAMSDLKEALDDGDFAAAAAAFRRSQTVCGSEYDEDSDDDEE